MQIIKELKNDLLKDSSLALGVFDGVHLGHQKVIRDAVERAIEMSLLPAVVTFSSHPRLVVSRSAPNLITTLEDKLQFFEELGIQTTVVIDFNEKLAKMTAEEYLKNVLQGCLGVKSISVGYNHKFGCDKKSASDFLKEYCSHNDINLSVISPVKIKGQVVSSSVIRGFITSGDVSSAWNFLGRPFKLKGKIVHGEQLGRKIGFPTANLSLQDDILLPLSGVYSGSVKVKGESHNAVINIGRKPTIANSEKDIVEAHILDFNEDIYGEELELFFFDRIRDEKKFDSMDELKKQIELDCLSAIQYYKQVL